LLYPFSLTTNNNIVVIIMLSALPLRFFYLWFYEVS